MIRFNILKVILRMRGRLNIIGPLKPEPLYRYKIGPLKWNFINRRPL